MTPPAIRHTLSAFATAALRFRCRERRGCGAQLPPETVFFELSQLQE